MNENIEQLFQEIENNPENLLTTLAIYGEYMEDSELEGVYNDWVESTRILLRKLKSSANKGLFSESVVIIEDVLDNTL